MTEQDKEKQINQLEQQIDVADSIIENLREKRDKAYSKRDVEKIEKELKEKKEKKASIEASNEAFYAQLKAWEDAPGGAGKPPDIIIVSTPGGQVERLNYYFLNTQIKQYNVSFARFDNPFKTYDSYTDAEKRVLLESIIPDNYTLPPGVTGLAGSTKVPQDMNNTKTVNAGIDDWEVWEPGKKGATEPTYRSWEWFKRWWEFHREYPRQELAWGTSASDFKDYPVLFSKLEANTDDGVKCKDTLEVSTPYRDAVAYINKIGKDNLYSSVFDSKLKDTNSTLLISCYYPKVNVFADPSIEYDSCYTGDFISFLIDETFRKDKRNDNLLLKANPTGKTYQVEPKNWREDNAFHFINTGYYSLKSGVSSYNASDHEVKGMPADKFVSSNYIITNSDIKRFTQISKGLNGLLDLASTMFETNASISTGTVLPKNLFYEREHRISLHSAGIATGPEGLPTDPPEPDFFKDKNIDASPKSKLPDLKDTKDLDKEIEDLEEKLDLAKTDNQEGEESRKALTLQIKEAQKRRDNLRKELNKILGTSENDLLRKVQMFIRSSKRTPKYRFALKQIYEFKENYELLEDAVVSRLKMEEKNASWRKDNSEELKDEFKRNGANAKTFFTITASEFDGDKDPTMKHQEDLKTAYNYAFGTDGIEKKIASDLGIWQRNVTNKVGVGGSIDKYLDEWLKDKSLQNAKKIKETLEALKRLEAEIDLEESWQEAKKRLEESEALAPAKNLEEFIKEILTGKTRQQIRDTTERWKKSAYGIGTAFYDLVATPDNIATDKDKANAFHTWLKSDEGVGSDAQDNFADWLISCEEVNDVVGAICEWRIRKYMELTTSAEKEKYTDKTLIKWFDEIRRCQRGHFLQVTVNNKNVGEFEKELREKSAGTPAKVYELDKSKTNELNKAIEWGSLSGDFKEFSKESKMNSLALAMDEEFLKAQGKGTKKEFIMAHSPQDVIKIVRSYQIEKSGITVETVLNIKKENRDQIDKALEVEALIEELISVKLASPEQLKIKAAIDKQKSVWESKTTPPPAKETDEKQTDEKQTDEKQTDEKQTDETTTETTDGKGKGGWYKNPWVWVGGVAALAVIGIAIWYFVSGKNKGEEGGEEETTPQS